jgi:CHASE3 domain sensor protein
VFRRRGSHRKTVARQQRAARWMALAVVVIAVALVSAAVLTSAQQGVHVFMS